MENLKDRYKEIDGKLCATTEEVCEQLNIARKTLSEWEEKGCPKAARGWWPIWDILRWRGLVGTGIKTEEDLENMSLASQKLKWEAEYKMYKAEEAEFNNAVARGEYVTKESVSSELQRFFVVLKRSLMAISRKVSNEVGAYVDNITVRKIEKMVTELLIDALGQLSIDGVYSATKKKKKEEA
ncbi:hypothetical protein OXPF_39490 [Oxobacter pfennigii]|uniref:Phage DNA packaging protein Nu1 n=1 Tax=Oxobacter pfennigii TaxID=36849 RepID=A0A0P8W3L0_9CLOT|nr:hypothetical protein [Oxobacter pfennigii]KPU42170.1 hypothetical protein OXPF_39490 [Oxobacter pfennigii]